MHFSKAGLVASLALTASAAVVYHTDVDVVYATEIVYVNQGGQTLSEVAYTPKPVASSAANKHHHGHHSHHWTPSVYSGPAYSPPASSSSASVPPPATTTAAASTTTTSAYVPPPSSTSTYSPPAQTTTLQTKTSPTTAPVETPVNACPGISSMMSIAASSQCGGASDLEYCQGAVGAHNLHRANHSAPAIVWNSTLENWARQHTNQCVFKDYLLDDGTYHQSNAFAATGTAGDALAATDDWYNSEEPLFASAGLYGAANPPADVDGHEIGHFANVVWKGWTSMGCATTLCSSLNSDDGSLMMSNANLTLCFYSVYDLAAQSYEVNVLPPKGCATWPASS